MDFLVYGMEMSLVQLNVSFIQLSFSSKGIALSSESLLSSKQIDNKTHLDSTYILLRNAYIQVTMIDFMNMIYVAHLFIIMQHGRYQPFSEISLITSHFPLGATPF